MHMNILTRELAAQVEMILYKYLGYCYSLCKKGVSYQTIRADLQPKYKHLDKEGVQSTGWASHVTCHPGSKDWLVFISVLVGG